MSSNFESIAAEAERLNPHEQFLLAERLMRNVGETPEHRNAWLKESERRATAIDRGEMGTVDAAEALGRLRKIVRG